MPQVRTVAPDFVVNLDVLRVRLEEKYCPEPNSGCFLWEGQIDPEGYGRLWYDGKKGYAHVASYLVTKGPVPEGLHIDHLCRTRACGRIDHLEAVPPRVNILRGIGIAARNAAKTHCPKDHPYDETNTCRSGGRRFCRTCLAAAAKRKTPIIDLGP